MIKLLRKGSPAGWPLLAVAISITVMAFLGWLAYGVYLVVDFWIQVARSI